MSNKFWYLGILSLLGFGLLTGFWMSPSPYRYPLDNHYALSGTFGELRSNHFHSGLDIKTHGKTGIPVLAIEAGYVFRLRVGPFGFGNAVYLRHPDGRYSVYAHLDRFTPELEDFIYQQQIKGQAFEQDVYLNQGQFSVERGDLIAYSGNSGSSFGPHLHFEIRDANEHILNPLPYFKNLIQDHKPPIVQEIAFEPLEHNARIEGEYRKRQLTPRGGSGRYELDGIIRLKGKVGLEYRAYDLLDNAPNKCGINYAQLYLDGQLIYDWELTEFAFEETRYLNLHLDYGHYQRTKERFERAYAEPGNRFQAVDTKPKKGIIDLQDDDIHSFRLTLRDGHGNQSEVRGKVQREVERVFPTSLTYYATPRVQQEIKREQLVITATRPHSSYWSGLTLEWEDGRDSLLLPSYAARNELVFLLPLEEGRYPSLIRDQVNQFRHSFGLQELITPETEHYLSIDPLQLYFPKGAAFQPIPLTVKRRAGGADMYSDIFEVGDPGQPLQDSYLVTFPGAATQSKHLVVAQLTGGKWEYAGSTVGEQAEVFAAMKEFGTFCLMADSVSPEIRPLNFGDGGYVSAQMTRLRVAVSDDFSGLESAGLYGTVDGEWVLWEYDYKAKTLTFDLRKNRPTPGMHQLRIFAKDKAQNTLSQTYQLRF
jgi:hypothetical protein